VEDDVGADERGLERRRREIEFEELEAGLVRQTFEVRDLVHARVVGREGVEPENATAVGGEAFGEMGTDEPRAAGDNDAASSCSRALAIA
jgi:hypothetical protein